MDIEFQMWFSKRSQAKEEREERKAAAAAAFHMESLGFESDCKWKQIFIVSSGFKCIISFVI